MPPEPHAISYAPPAQVRGRWIPRAGGHVKINVDAGVSCDHNVGTAAAICCDRDGSWLGSSLLVIQGLVDPSTLESLACR